MVEKKQTPDLWLGQAVTYTDQYDASLLFPVPRCTKRVEIGVDPDCLPFAGVDVWHAYEVSWLNTRGKPQVALARVTIGCNSVALVESKSFKLYLNSFNQSVFVDWSKVQSTIQRDLTALVQGEVTVELFRVDQGDAMGVSTLPGQCLDQLDIDVDTYTVDPALLQADASDVVAETWYSHLLKSNCLVTGQPDWGSILIDYVGPKIDPAGLLRYLISFRQHDEFHEQCVERVFHDVMTHCQASRLTVQACYTRRGGLDINPLRTTERDVTPQPRRLLRQ